MKIGGISSGKMGSGLAKFWAAKGHQIKFSFANTPGKLESFAQALGFAGSIGTPDEVAEWGDVLLLTVPWLTVDAAIAATSGKLSAKAVISCVTPLKPDFSGLEVGLTTSAAEIIVGKLPGAKVVAVLFAFAELLHSGSVKIALRRLHSFIAAMTARPKSPLLHLFLILDWSRWIVVRCATRAIYR